MGHILWVLTVLILFLSQQVCSISNHVTYLSERQSSPAYLDQLDWSAGEKGGQSDTGLSLTGHKYCNDYRNIQGHEGTLKPGFTLRQVHIVLSPTQTSSPLETNDHQLRIPEPPCQILLKSEDSQKIHSFTESSRTYAAVQDNKHGFKHFHPILRSSCTGSYLTSTGLKQSISVGEQLSKSYFADSKIKFKPDNNNVRAESITEQLPYHSLLAFLHGFLPEKTFAKTKVQKVSGNFCNFDKKANISCHCRTANYLYKPVRQSVMRGRYLFKDGYPGKDLLNSIFDGISTQNLSPLDLYQSSMHHICDNLNVVCDKNSNCLNISEKDHIEPVLQIVSSFLQTLSHDPTFQLFSQLYTSPFLHGLVLKADRQDVAERIHIYSGDRLFLHVLLTSLGIRLKGSIPIASRLVVEVYQKNRGQLDEGLLFFSILYNGEDVTHQLVFCEARLEEGLCSLQRLKEMVTVLQSVYQENC